MSRPTVGNLSRRIFLTIIVLIITVLLFTTRLISLQVVQAAQLNKEAQDKRGVSQAIPAYRGQILDDHGAVLAETVKRYTVTTDQRNVGPVHRQTKNGTTTISVEQAASQLAAILGTSSEAIMAALVSTPAKAYSVVAKGVDVRRYQAIRDLDLPWLYYTQTIQRLYPNGQVAGNLVGFTNSSMTGQQGIEAMENKCLAGKNGKETYDLSTELVPIPGTTVVEKNAVDGGTVRTTINRDLQWYAEQQITQRVKELKAKWGAIVVMDAKTGALRAVADTPAVDPNDLSATNAENWGSRAFSTPVEPGSTMKSVTVAAGLQVNALTPLTQVTAPYSRNVGNGIEFSDSFLHGVMKLTTTGVLRYSSNTGVSKLGEMYPTSVRYAYLKKFGFGSPTGVGFTGESSGLVRNYKNWDKATKYTTMFGQGISATLVQIASLYQTIANNGVRVQPSLVTSCTAADGTVTKAKPAATSRVLTTANATTMRKMLLSVVTEGTATAAQVPGYQVAGKTGTAQIAKAGGGGYAAGSYATSFVGMAPAANPRYVVGVLVFDPQSDKHSTNSTDVFSNVMAQVLKHYKVAPSTTEIQTYPTKW